jgi:transposase
LKRIVRRCAGLDVHKASITACVRIGAAKKKDEEPHQEIREFDTTTKGLLRLRDWLAAFEVELVGMEATGAYWKPAYYVLEEDFECWLLNARHMKNVPGKKTDVKDAEWICQLVEHGLVRPSFVPPKEIRELRDLTRYRKRQIEERAREVQRLEKVLQDVGIKLSSVATRVLGVSGRAMLDALVDGTTDPEVLADLAKARLRKKIPALKEALEGHFSKHHAFMVGRILAHIDYLHESIADLSSQIERVKLAPFFGAGGASCHHPRCKSQDGGGPDRRDRHRHEPVPHRRAPRLMGGDVPGQRRVGGQAAFGQDDQRLRVAAFSPHRSGPRSGAHQGELPECAVCRHQRAAGLEEGGRRGRALDPGDLLPPAEAQRALRGTR